MLTDYTVSHIVLDSGEGSDNNNNEPTTSEAPLKRLRLSARTLFLDIRDINDPIQARSAVSDLRLQTEVRNQLLSLNFLAGV